MPSLHVESLEITFTVPLILGNPIHTYNVVKRLAVDFVSLEKEINNDDWKGTVRLYSTCTGTVQYLYRYCTVPVH